MRMDRTLFRGSGVALVTPFYDGEIDFPALGRLIDRQLAAGTDAIIVCGTTGEPPTLTQTEKDEILAYALERTNDRVPVIAGAGCNSTKESIRQAARAHALGADGILAVTPYYNKTTQAGLIAHFTAIADAARLPLILYNVPSRTGLNLLPETAAALSAHPNICGIKDAAGDISQTAELMRAAEGRLTLYAGNDDQVLPVLALGGQGVISAAANVIPRRMHRLAEAWFEGEIGAARAVQLEILPLVRHLFAEVNPIPVKAALQLMGLCRADVRLPLVRLSESRWRPLKEALIALDEQVV